MDLHGVAIVELANRFGRQPGAGRHEPLQPRRPLTVGGVIEKILKHEGNAGEPPRIEAKRVNEQLMRHERLTEHDRRALQKQRHRQDAEPVGMRQGNRRHLRIIRTDPHAVDDLRSVVDQLFVGDESRLWRAGRAGRQLKKRDIRIRPWFCLVAHGERQPGDTHAGHRASGGSGGHRQGQHSRLKPVAELNHFTKRRSRIDSEECQVERPTCEKQRHAGGVVARARNNELVWPHAASLQSVGQQQVVAPDVGGRSTGAESWKMDQQAARGCRPDIGKAVENSAHCPRPLATRTRRGSVIDDWRRKVY